MKNLGRRVQERVTSVGLKSRIAVQVLDFRLDVSFPSMVLDEKRCSFSRRNHFRPLITRGLRFAAMRVPASVFLILIFGIAEGFFVTRPC